MAENEYTNFDYNVEQLTKPIDLNITRQEEIMNSEDFNNSLLSIQNNLDILYEKTRYLESSIDYTKTFLDQKIKTFDDRMASIIKSVEDIKSINKNMSYLEFPVPFQRNTVDTTDRNKDYKVEPCDLNDNSKVLTLSAHANQTYKFTSINRTSEKMPYDSNINDMINGEKYRAIYIEDRLQRDGIIENYTCYLPYAVEVNNINIVPVNCTVHNTTLVYPNGVTELLDDKITGINVNSRMITHFTFSLKCTTYEIVEYVLDKELANADNVWDEIKNFEYNLNFDKDTKVEVEALIERTSIDVKSGRSKTKKYKDAPGETVKIVKYIYVLGIDSITANLLMLNNNCYFLSETIDTGHFEQSDYLQLAVSDNIGEFSSIEYYIVDGNMEIPILPISEKYVYNERIFPETDLRFEMDEGLYAAGVIKIKKDGMAIDTTLNNVIDQYDGVYSISYQQDPNVYSYTPINDSIRIKAIIRYYGNTLDTIPYIETINIRKYGGNTLWTQLY